MARRPARQGVLVQGEPALVVKVEVPFHVPGGIDGAVPSARSPLEVKEAARRRELAAPAAHRPPANETAAFVSAEHLERLMHHEGLRFRGQLGDGARERAVVEKIGIPAIGNDQHVETSEVTHVGAVQHLEQRELRRGVGAPQVRRNRLQTIGDGCSSGRGGFQREGCRQKNEKGEQGGSRRPRSSHRLLFPERGGYVHADGRGGAIRAAELCNGAAARFR